MLKTQKDNFGVKHKLYLSLFVLNMLAFVIGFTAWSAFRSSGNTMRMITEEMMPVREAVSKIIVLSAHLSTLSPQLIFAQTEGELDDLHLRLSSILSKKQSLVSSINNEGEGNVEFFEILKKVKNLNFEMDGYLNSFSQDVLSLIQLNQLQTATEKKLSAAHADFIIGTSPVSDDAQFELLVGLEGAENVESQLSKQAETLALALEIKAEGNLLAGIIETVFHYKDPAGIVPLRERFDATLGRLQGYLSRIDQGHEAFFLINNSVMTMGEIGGGENNVFDIQKKRLQKNTLLQKNLKNIGRVTQEINVSVDVLANYVGMNIEKIKNKTEFTLKIGIRTILLVSAISIIFTIILSWFYIRNQIVDRIDKLKVVMLALANKNFDYVIEGGENKDEIGQMAAVLLTFREKLIENEVLTQDLNTAMEASVEAKNKMAAILNATGDGIYALDIDGYTTVANPAAEKMLGYSKEEMSKKPQHDLIHYSHADGSVYLAEECYIYNAIQKGETSYVEDEVFWRKDGTSFPVSYHSTPIIDGDNNITGAVVSFQDITERKEKESTLRHAKRQAEHASHAKSEFLANMSHELRTPLNSIMGMSQILLEDMRDGDERDMVSTVNKSANVLLDTVNDILDLSKIEAKQMVLENIGFDFKETLSSIIETLAPIASRKGVWLHYKYKKKGLPYVKGDPVRLGRILTNLISNAIKYTAKGGVEVDIDFNFLDKKKEEIELKCSVIDTGIGIAEDKHEAIFQKFTQADESTTRQFGGTGLGLAITKDLVEMMDGKIGIDSVEGEGATFWFRIPFLTTQVLHHEARESRNMGTEREHKNSIHKVSISDAKILIAEDHELNQLFIKKLLNRMGFKNYKLVNNGVAAVEEYKTGEYFLILMDCHMPELNGYQATEEIRKIEEGGELRIPIIALTADAMVGTREKCTQIGMDDYVSKPIDASIFEGVLSQWFVLGETQESSQDEGEGSQSSDVLDLSTIKEYAETDEEMQDYCSLFFSQTEESLIQLQEQCTDGENIEWSEIAHKVKGGSGMVGALQLHKLAAEAQEMAQASKDQRKKQLYRIRKSYAEAKELLEKQVLVK